jgi:hypothetical protein
MGDVASAVVGNKANGEPQTPSHRFHRLTKILNPGPQNTEYRSQNPKLRTSNSEQMALAHQRDEGRKGSHGGHQVYSLLRALCVSVVNLPFV